MVEACRKQSSTIQRINMRVGFSCDCLRKANFAQNERMLIRIVKLTFQVDKAEGFLQIFETKKPKILEFEGCHHLELWRDKNKRNVFFTCSHWENEDYLNAYRHSDFFRATWAKTKAAFSDKPEAWSVEKMEK